MNAIDQLAGALEQRQSLDSLCFDTPWSARAFGLVLAAAEARLFSLADFQRHLIGVIQAHEARDEPIDDEHSYYSCWVEALSAAVCATTAASGERMTQAEQAILDRVRALHAHGHAPDGSPQPVAIAR